MQNVTGKARECIQKQIEFAKKQLVTSYKGVGRKIASILLIEVPELGMIDNKEIACLVGVAPKTNASRRKVSKAQIIGGRFYARKKHYTCLLWLQCVIIGK